MKIISKPIFPNKAKQIVTCLEKYDKQLCEDCIHLFTESVSHPGGSSVYSVEKARCEEGYWEEDF